jgi:hypothetical protein
VKSGWSSVPTCFGGSVPLQGDLSSDKLGFLSIFEASNSLLPGDAMVNGHLLQPGRSAFIVHVRYNMLLKMATKKMCVFFAREEAGYKLYAPTDGGEEDRKEFTRTRMCFFFFRGCPRKKWVVITKTFE